MIRYLRPYGRADRRLGPLGFTGAPGAGTNEVQTLTIGGTPTGGTFRLRYRGATTGNITWVSSNVTLVSNIQAALRALPSINGANVTVATGTASSGIGTFTITFGGALARAAVPTILVVENAMTGTSPTVAVAETTPGVTATLRGARAGALAVRVDDPGLFLNVGDEVSPDWEAVAMDDS